MTVENLMGQTLLQETYVYTGAGYERIEWTDYRLDDYGHVTDTYRSDGSRSEALWGCCGKDYEKDGTGRETYYDYDALSRVTMVTRMGIAAGAYPAQVDTYIEYTLDVDLLPCRVECLQSQRKNYLSETPFQKTGQHLILW